MSANRVGVLLVNLGTPDAPTPRAVRRYLTEFLSDTRVVELPPAVWRPLLAGLILPLRARKSARAYQEIWTETGSPLAAITKNQADALQSRLSSSVIVRWAMRYGRPSIGHEISALQDEGCSKVLIAPLYPQYSAATSGSAMDAVGSFLRSRRNQPAIRVMPPYFDDLAYINALATDCRRQIEGLPFEPQLLLLSFHGLPERSSRMGDPYHAQCLKTASLLRQGLSRVFPALRMDVSFQSRFGPAQWLTPYTEDLLIGEAAHEAGRRVIIAAPGFAADCLETREELAIRAREAFHAAGGDKFAVLDCLNNSEAGMQMLEKLTRRELMGWI